MDNLNNTATNIALDKFTTDYNLVMQLNIVNKEWSTNNDYFKKFSLFNDCTPVQTSNSTVIK